jgi:hypothetical protein
MDILGYLYAIAITVGGIAGYINKGTYPIKQLTREEFNQN